jgi:tyrosine-protein kinase Etk/Wzc
MKHQLMKPSTDRPLMEGILHYLSILLKYKWLVIIVTGLALIGTVAFSYVSVVLPPDKSPLPNFYTAEATIFIQQGQQNDLSDSIMSALGIERGAVQVQPEFEMGALVLQVLRSRSFIDKVVEEFDIVNKYKIDQEVRSTSRSLVLGKSSFTYNRNTSSIGIAFEDIDPVFARDVANRMVNLLNDWFAQNMGTTNESEKKMLEEKVNEVKGEVTRLENLLKNLQKKYGVLTAQDLGSSQSSALAELRSQLILKEIEIKNYSTISAIEDPKIQQLKDERQNILDLIDEQIAQGGASATDSLNIADVVVGQKSLPDIQLEFNHLSMELDVQRKIYNTISHQYEVLKIASEPQPTFQVLELAEVPDVKSGPQRSSIVFMGTGIAFVISMAAAFLLNTILAAAANRKKHPASGSTEGNEGAVTE